MNREQRRQQKRSKRGQVKKPLPAYKRMTPDQRMDELVKNGITIEDLKTNYDNGFTEGFKAASEPVVKGIYAAVCLALNDLHGFNKKRCLDVLNKIDEHVIMSLTSTEAIDAVYERMGLELNFAEPFDRVSEVE